ncbi:MAG TPA: hypothetical protein VHD63_19820 [Ktedonobacteraceae bacterium]|nr:hypothetical protein [Ktedonobacteraceae bacterium]
MTKEEKEKLRQLWQTNPELRQRYSDMWKKLGFAGPPFPEEQMNEGTGGNEDSPFS